MDKRQEAEVLRDIYGDDLDKELAEDAKVEEINEEPQDGTCD